MPPPENNVVTSTTVHVKGVSVTSGPSVTTAAVSGNLPFTGGRGVPLAGLGMVMIGTGLGLARRKGRVVR